MKQKEYNWKISFSKIINANLKTVWDIISKESYEREELRFFESIISNYKNLLFILLEIIDSPKGINENKENKKFESYTREFYFYLEDSSSYIGNLHEILTHGLLKIRNNIVNFKIKN